MGMTRSGLAAATAAVRSLQSDTNCRDGKFGELLPSRLMLLRHRIMLSCAACRSARASIGFERMCTWTSMIMQSLFGFSCRFFGPVYTEHKSSMGHAAAPAALCVPFAPVSSTGQALSLSKGERIGQPVCHGPEALFHLLFDAPSNETQVRLGTNARMKGVAVCHKRNIPSGKRIFQAAAFRAWVRWHRRVSSFILYYAVAKI